VIFIVFDKTGRSEADKLHAMEAERRRIGRVAARLNAWFPAVKTKVSGFGSAKGDFAKAGKGRI
jgi:hypothetical protein